MCMCVYIWVETGWRPWTCSLGLQIWESGKPVAAAARGSIGLGFYRFGVLSVWGLGFRVQGFRVRDLRFMVLGSLVGV